MLLQKDGQFFSTWSCLMKIGKTLGLEN